jgi:subtilisin family serine protease
MNGFLNKLDTELQVIYSTYLDYKKRGKPKKALTHPVAHGDARLSVLLTYSGSIDEIERLGFLVTSRKSEHQVQGKVYVKELEQIARSDQVISLSVGQPGVPMLNTSVREINARGAGNVWQFNTSANSFDGTTGNGVVIGIIDTGIDWTHPVFYSTNSPPTTRIRRIWDPGIDPHDGVQSPEASYMDGSDRYGVVYTDTMIDAVLRGNASFSTIKHRDCNGHGTHVASIAAGNGRMLDTSSSPPTYSPPTNAGVAPEADIVVVKVLYLFKSLPQASDGTYILYDQMFKDAVTFIMKVAELDLGNKPVVINYSIGSSIAPHDGFTDQEEWLTQKFGAGGSRGLFCTAAGNDRDDNIHAIATIPNDGGGNGQIDIPFRIEDTRDTNTSFDRCETKDNTKRLYIGMWYRQPSSGNVLPHLTLPGGSEAPGLAVSATIQHGYFGNSGQYHHTFIHSTKTFTKPATGGAAATSVTRNEIILDIQPTMRGEFLQSTYRIRLTGPAGAVIHIYIYKPRYNYGFRFPTSAINGLVVQIPANASHLIGRPGGANNILTVASYSDEDSGEPLSSFSSPGPLVDYSPAGNPYIDKPDVAAPGDLIRAAGSSHTELIFARLFDMGHPIHGWSGFGGTSMASPHVAGLAALLLEKNNNLTTQQLITFIKNNVQPVSGAPLAAVDWGSGKIDAKRAFDNTPNP